MGVEAGLDAEGPVVPGVAQVHPFLLQAAGAAVPADF